VAQAVLKCPALLIGQVVRAREGFAFIVLVFSFPFHAINRARNRYQTAGTVVFIDGNAAVDIGRVDVLRFRRGGQRQEQPWQNPAGTAAAPEAGQARKQRGDEAVCRFLRCDPMGSPVRPHFVPCSGAVAARFELSALFQGPPLQGCLSVWPSSSTGSFFQKGDMRPYYRSHRLRKWRHKARLSFCAVALHFSDSKKIAIPC